MADEEISPAPLSEMLDKYRSRILQLNRNMFTKLLDKLSISPTSTNPSDLERIEQKEWLDRAPGSPPTFPSSVKTPNDVYPLLSNGTSPPRSQAERASLFLQIEEALNAQAEPKFRPIFLPEDFKELCALTDSLEGAGLPQSHNDQTPDAFNGLSFLLDSLQGTFTGEPLSVEECASDADMEDVDWEVAAGVQTGAFEGQGGMWLCWCRNENELSDTTEWKWRWCGRNGVRTVMYENVREMLDAFWCEWKGINAVYGDLGYNGII